METTISSYEQQAIDFLAATQTKIEFKFKEFGSMSFDKNGEKRNIWSVTLSNDKHKYTFDFGDSIQNSCKDGAIIYSHEKTSIHIGFRSQTNHNIWFGLDIQTDYPTLLAIHKGERELSINDVDLKRAYNEYCERVSKRRAKNRVIYVPMSLERIQSEYITKALNRKINEALKEQTKIREQTDELVTPSAYSVLSCVQKYDPGTFENFCGDFGYNADSREAMRVYKAVRKEWRNIEKLFTEDQLSQLQEIN